MGRNQYLAGRVYDLCVYYMTGTPEGSTESGFMEKPGIEPATPGLQGIALIHYTTGASHLTKRGRGLDRKRGRVLDKRQFSKVYTNVLLKLYVSGFIKNQC